MHLSLVRSTDGLGHRALSLCEENHTSLLGLLARAQLRAEQNDLVPLNWEMFPNIVRLLFGINRELRGRAAGQAEVEEDMSAGRPPPSGLPRHLRSWAASSVGVNWGR